MTQTEAIVADARERILQTDVALLDDHNVSDEVMMVLAAEHAARCETLAYAVHPTRGRSLLLMVAGALMKAVEQIDSATVQEPVLVTVGDMVTCEVPENPSAVTLEQAQQLCEQNGELACMVDNLMARLRESNDMLGEALQIRKAVDHLFDVMGTHGDQDLPIFSIRDDDPVMVAAIVHAIHDLSAVSHGQVRPGFWVYQKGTVH